MVRAGRLARQRGYTAGIERVDAIAHCLLVTAEAASDIWHLFLACAGCDDLATPQRKGFGATQARFDALLFFWREFTNIYRFSHTPYSTRFPENLVCVRTRQ